MNHAGMTANGLASSEAGLFFVSGEYSYVEEFGFQNNFKFTEATTIRVFLTLRSVEEKSTDSTVRECKKK